MKSFAQTFIVMAALLPLTARAALVTSNQATSAANAGTVTVSGTGCVSGDYVILEVTESSNTPSPFTWPSGFTQFAQAINNGANRGPFHLSVTLAWGTAISGSYTISNSDGVTLSAIAACWSGRQSVAPTVYAASNNINGSSSPISVSLTGVTAASGSDLSWWASLTQPGAWVFTAPSGFTPQQTIAPATGIVPVNLSTKDNASGATGTLTGTATLSGQQADYAGVVVALPPSSSSTNQSQGFFF